MKWSFAIGSFRGTEVRVHLTLVILLAWIGLSYYALGGARAAASGLVYIALIFASVTAHEFGHVLVARTFGVRTPDIMLLPIGGASRMEEIPEDPRQEALIGLAGPLVSLAIAGVLIAFLGRMPNLDDLAPERLAGEILLLPQLAIANLILAAFNLLPAFPMDGGRILRALLSMRMGRLRATRTATRIGQGFAILFALLGLMSGNFILVLIGIVLFFVAASESGTVRLEEALRGLTAADAMITQFEVLRLDANIADAAEALIRTTQSEFPVVDGSGRFRGMLTREGIASALARRGRAALVLEAMERDIPEVGPSHSLDGIFSRQLGRAPAIAVLNGDGSLIGYITIQNLLETMMAVEAPREWRSDHSALGRTS